MGAWISDRLSGVPTIAWVILGGAFVVRLLALGFVWDMAPGIDAENYHNHAVSLASGDGYPPSPFFTVDTPTAIRPPGYPGGLALLYLVFGESARVGQIAGAFAGVAAVALVGVIAWQLLQSRRAAVIALAIAAVYPPLVVLSVTLMSEAMFIPLELAAVAATLRAREQDEGIRWALIAGVLIGLATLTRLVGAVVLIPLLLTVWKRRPLLSRRALSAPVAMGLVAAVIVLPWTLRNTIEMDRFVPFGTQGGLMLSGTYNDITRDDPRHEWREPYEISPYDSVFLDGKIANEAEQSAELADAGRDYIRDHLTLPLQVALSNLQRTLELPPRTPSELDAELLGFSGEQSDSPRVRVVFWACQVGFLLLLACSIPAVRSGAWRRIPLPLLVLLPLLVTVTTLFISGQLRYRLPVDFVLIVLAAATLARAGGSHPIRAKPLSTSLEESRQPVAS